MAYTVPAAPTDI